MSAHFQTFAALHVPGAPLILYNIWDPGSAEAVAAGAKAIATGSFSVAAAFGAEDGEQLPLELALGNAERIVAAVDLPVTVDFEGGYAVEPDRLAENMRRLAATGAVGCNIEDQIVSREGLHPLDRQCERLKAARSAAGSEFFINARTDIFLKEKPDRHDLAMVESALARAEAYAEAGASAIFVPGLVDLKLVEAFCSASPLPVNVMASPNAASAQALASAGAARISHGPFPYRQHIQALSEAAKAAFGR